MDLPDRKSFKLVKMSEGAIEEVDVYLLQAKITQQQSLIKEHKKQTPIPPAVSLPPDHYQQLQEMVGILNNLRAQMATLQNSNQEKELPFPRKSFDELIVRKMYVVPSFEIHNGPAGLFDYGPPACALKSNMLSLWRQHFVLEENMLEMECTNLTPSAVLETSGHVDRFTDFMVRDEVTLECFRADKLLEEAIDNLLATSPNMTIQDQEKHKIVQRQADAFSETELHEMLQLYNVKSPSNPQNNLTKPFPFNLMFKTTIGPEGTAVGYLRPETAQGLFVNFRRLLDYNQQRMPFAAAQIGLGFRNEIAPRNGLLRVREFCMAEIEHFVNPTDKSYPKFASLKDKELVLFSSDAQLSTGRTVAITIGEAVRTGMVNNETLGYFMTRTQIWLEKVGVNPKKMRLRQHLKTEMAHYAADCWDMEIQMSYGWIECVGHADRACYDLEQHSHRTGVPMVASVRLAEPIQIEKVVAEPNKKLIGPRFKGDQKIVTATIEGLSEAAAEDLKASLEKDGQASIAGPAGEGPFTITPDLVSFSVEKKTVSETKYTPSVIEPSYGIGRILYAVLEHAFSQRDNDEQRCVMSFKPCVAPIKVGIFRLINHTPFDVVVNSIRDSLQYHNLSTRVDSSSGSVGRRYCRADELGIPFGVTVDFQTLLDATVTLRDRDSMAQVRVAISALTPLILQLVKETITWETVMSRFRVVSTGDDEEVDEDGAATAGKASAVSLAPVVVEYTTRASFSRPNPLKK